MSIIRNLLSVLFLMLVIVSVGCDSSPEAKVVNNSGEPINVSLCSTRFFAIPDGEETEYVFICWDSAVVVEWLTSGTTKTFENTKVFELSTRSNIVVSADNISITSDYF